MNPLLSAALFITEKLLLNAPALFLQFQAIIARQGVTAAEIAAKRAALEAQTFESLVPNSELPPGEQAP